MHLENFRQIQAMEDVAKQPGRFSGAARLWEVDLNAPRLDSHADLCIIDYPGRRRFVSQG